MNKNPVSPPAGRAGSTGERPALSEGPRPAGTQVEGIVWKPDNEDGTYKNPVIFADYSDPDVICVGDDFYLTASSFNCVPGLPILHSKDLVNWKIIGHAIERLEDERFNMPQHGNGVWAPSIRYHDGWFWIFYGDPDAGVFMTKARNPAGPWEPLHLVHEGKGLIDTCPLWDDDGSAYLVHAWANSRAGINSILTVHRMSQDGRKLLDEGTMVFDGRNGIQPTLEGPKFYKRNGYYYILAPAGGVRQGWQLALRSKNVFGPYEAKKVLEQGTTGINGPHQGGLVELENGEGPRRAGTQNWFLHFQDRDAYGRVTHLNPVRWVDDWPLMGNDFDGNGIGEPVTEYKKPDVGKTYPIEVPQTSDEFDSPSRSASAEQGLEKLGLQWQWQANPKDGWMSLSARSGWLRLFSVPIVDNSPSRPSYAGGESDSAERGAVNLWPVPNFILQKFPAPQFFVTTKLEFGKLSVGDKTGLIIMGMDYSYLAIERTSTGCRLIKQTCKNAGKNGVEINEGSVGLPKTDSILLRVKIGNGAVCNFSYSSDGKKFTEIGQPFTAQPGRWIGAKTGLFCLVLRSEAPLRRVALSQKKEQGTGYADYDWFRIE